MMDEVASELTPRDMSTSYDVTNYVVVNFMAYATEDALEV